MSRIGKQPVVIPQGVKVSRVEEGGGAVVSVEGPKGKLSLRVRPEVAVTVEPNAVTVERRGEGAFERAYHGTIRALIANMVRGVREGFEKRLEIEGIGYNAKVEKGRLVLAVGFSHPVEISVPEGLTVQTPKPTNVVIQGADKQLVGEFAARVRKVRPPEPYKGKGIRYAGEKIQRKVGKTFGSAT
ncbi:MAG: 50S ribosomal protein L6 [Planctomycetota bacterium]